MLHGLDAAISISDRAGVQAAHDLAALGVHAGPCGGSGLAAARSALMGPDSEARRSHLGLDSNSIVLLIITEGSDANPLPPLEN
jgi:diaminopropionate ammonia-lyase